jgi:hypothetical protein
MDAVTAMSGAGGEVLLLDGGKCCAGNNDLPDFSRDGSEQGFR